jgi:hypothetical protein
MVSRSFWVKFFGSLRYSIILSTNRDILTVSLPICILFISSSYLIAPTRNSSTMLHRSGDSGHSCLVPDFRGNGFSFSPLSMMLAVGLSHIAWAGWWPGRAMGSSPVGLWGGGVGVVACLFF